MKSLDLISPNITLNYNGKNKHSNKLGGILTILVAVCSLAITIYFGLELWERKHPKAYLINKYVDDIGSIKMDQSSMFHIIGFGNSRSGGLRSFDTNTVQILGSLYNVKGKRLMSYEYGKCISNLDGKGLEEIFPMENFELFHCIKITLIYRLT